MRRVILISTAVLISSAAAFADEPVLGADETVYPAMDDYGPELTLRFGVAFGEPVNVNMSGPTFRGFNNAEIKSDDIARPYFAVGVPIAMVDRWALMLNGDISFTSSDSLDMESILTNSGASVSDRDFLVTDDGYWGSLELLASYDIGDIVPFLGDVEVFGGVRYENGYARASNAVGTFSSTLDFVHYRQETLAPVVGINTTFKSAGQGVFGGDIHFSAMAGPVVWGNMDYREDVLSPTNMLHVSGDVDGGYYWKLYGDVEIFSQEVVQSAGFNGGISLFAQVSQSSVSGSGMMEDYSVAGGFAPPQPYNVDSSSLTAVIGISATLRF